jgi:hypothetical protein
MLRLGWQSAVEPAVQGLVGRQEHNESLVPYRGELAVVLLLVTMVLPPVTWSLDWATPDIWASQLPCFTPVNANKCKCTAAEKCMRSEIVAIQSLSFSRFQQHVGTMSWQAYVDQNLMCPVDTEGRTLSGGALVGLDDQSVWAKSAEFPDISTEEVRGASEEAAAQVVAVCLGLPTSSLVGCSCRSQQSRTSSQATTLGPLQSGVLSTWSV